MPDFQPYPLHGGQLRQISERFGIPQSQLLDFSANINPAGPPPAALAELRASLNDLSVLTEYPDLQHTELKRAIASYAAVSPQHVIAANGFIPLLEATLRVLNIRNCILPIPSFVEYRRTLERAGITIEPRFLNAESSFAYDAASMFAGHQDAILLANPQNPSGVCQNIASIREIVAKASEQNTYVLLDEAFIDYVPQHSLTQAIDDFANLIVFRSVTKFHGFPGLRVAYAVTNSALAASLSDSLPPWPITTLAARAVSAALADQAYVDRSISENLSCRFALQNNLESLGLHPYPSSANFILFRLPTSVEPNSFWQRMIIKHHIVLRSCANYESLAPGHFRVAVKSHHENMTLAMALKKALPS
jgi:threonine-phosphate decarboxylase